jgi:hypothetical protein
MVNRRPQRILDPRDRHLFNAVCGDAGDRQADVTCRPICDSDRTSGRKEREREREREKGVAGDVVLLSRHLRSNRCGETRLVPTFWIAI